MLKFIGTFAACCIIATVCISIVANNINVTVNINLKHGSINDFTIKHKIENDYGLPFKIEHRGIN